MLPSLIFWLFLKKISFYFSEFSLCNVLFIVKEKLTEVLNRQTVFQWIFFFNFEQVKLGLPLFQLMADVLLDNWDQLGEKKMIWSSSSLFCWYFLCASAAVENLRTFPPREVCFPQIWDQIPPKGQMGVGRSDISTTSLPNVQLEICALSCAYLILLNLCVLVE